jgi:hypothetical protein
VYGVGMPPFFHDLLEPFEFFSDLAKINPVNWDCTGNAAVQLLTYGLLPLLLPALLLIFVVIFKSFQRPTAIRSVRSVFRSTWRATFVSAFQSTVPVSLLICFMSVITVSDKIFAVFDCVEVEADSLQVVAQTRLFMRSQLDMECDKSIPDYRRIWAIAMTLLFIWPVGMPILFMLSMLPIRADLLKGHQTPVTQRTAFLHREYEPPYFMWEPIAMLHRLAVVGCVSSKATLLVCTHSAQAPVCSSPASTLTSVSHAQRTVPLLRFLQLMPAQMNVSRIFSGVLISLAYFVLLLQLKPYHAFQTDVLAIVTQLIVVLVLIAFGACVTSYGQPHCH